MGFQIGYGAYRCIGHIDSKNKPKMEHILIIGGHIQHNHSLALPLVRKTTGKNEQENGSKSFDLQGIAVMFISVINAVLLNLFFCSIDGYNSHAQTYPACICQPMLFKNAEEIITGRKSFD